MRDFIDFCLAILGRMVSCLFSLDIGGYSYLAPCLGNNFSVNHNYGSPNYVRRYYWSSTDRLSYTDTYVTVKVNHTFFLFYSDELLMYCIIFLIGCCLICLFKRSGR